MYPVQKCCTERVLPAITEPCMVLTDCAEIFRTIYSQIDLSVGKISDRNTVIRFIGIHHDIG